jgi:hypothetical protein
LELAELAVTHGLSLAKFVGAKITIIIVEEGLPSWLSYAGVAEASAQYAEQANAAQQAGVPCNTVQVQVEKDLQPYEAGRGPGLRSHCHGIAQPQRTICNRARQRDEQGPDPCKNAGVGLSVNVQTAR